VLAKDPQLTAAETKALLLRTASDAISGRGRRGADRVVNAEAAVRAAAESAERRKPPEERAAPPAKPATR